MSPHHNRMIVRGLLTGGVLGKRRFAAQMSLRAKEAAQSVEIFLPYGMSVNPVPGATADMVAFEIGGTRDHLVGLLDDSSLRIAGLAQGEFGWQDNQGQQIVFRQSSSSTPGIVITSTLPVTINGNVTVNGNLTVTGDTSFGGGAKKVVLDGDSVSGGVVHASSTTIKAT